MRARILVVDDEAEIRRSVRMILEYDGYDVLEASSGPEGVALAEKEAPDLVFLDVKMPGMDGLEALQRLRAVNETLPVVIISGHGTVSTAVEATKAGAFDFIEKPLASERVLLTIRNALDQTRLADENRSLKRAAEVRHQMVGESPALRHIWDAIKRAAPTNATVLRLGSARTIKVDVRVIAATNKDLEQEIERGTFREDLYFRLSVIPIKVPPLRERRDDIPLLVRHFTELFSREHNRRPHRFAPAALEYMQKARWKGNVRELKNTVERLLIMTPGDTVDVDDLRDVVRLEPKSQGPDNDRNPGTLREFKESAERAFLVGKLRENGWNISKTAEVIGTPRSNLYKKLEQYGIAQETDG